MKIIKTTTVMLLLATLFVACSKDKASRISIFANNMGNGGKVWLDPSNFNASTWVADETINFNGSLYPISQDGSDGFCLNIEPQNEVAYAVYPGTTKSGGNDIEVTNSRASGASIVIRSLAVNFRNGGHRVIFPMADKADPGSDALYFNHLTAGFLLTLANSDTEHGFDVDHVKVVVQGTSAAAPVTREGVSYSTTWYAQGPTVPGGELGGITGDQEVCFSSEMLFVMQTNDNPGVTIPAKENGVDGKISFCIPVTVSTVRMISVTGYDANGTQLFSKVKKLDPAIALTVNNMYRIPSFVVNAQ